MLRDINNLKWLSFSKDEQQASLYTVIEENPSKYLNIARYAENLRHIKVPVTQSEEFYESLKEFVENCNDKVIIHHGTIGEATKEEYMEAEEIIERYIRRNKSRMEYKTKISICTL